MTLPRELILVRHGQSAGNLERDAAEEGGRQIMDLPARDMDVPLSALGERQAQALGAWLAKLPPHEQPSAVLTSPYLRARQTLAIVCETAGLPIESDAFVVDERLREKELGLLNRLTRAGIVALFPQEAELRARIGKFYYRPPSGESWCDVILRLRSVFGDVRERYAGKRVLIVAHQVVVLCFRYLLEGMTEEQILRIDAEGDVANCSVTSYLDDGGSEAKERTPATARAEALPEGQEGPGVRMTLRHYNFVAPMLEAGAPVTDHPDVPVGAR